MATLIFLITLDGSSGYGQYRFKDAPDQNNLMVSSLTILRLVVEYEDQNNQTVLSTLWENLMPNSPYAITPLRMKFEAETTGIDKNNCSIENLNTPFKTV